MMQLPIIGRAEELAELRRAWTHRPAARPVTVVVTGAAGCGKSLLVATALGSLRPAPATVLSGRARIHAPAPYDWLASTLGAQDTDHLPIPADALAWLAQQPVEPTRRYAPGALLRLAVRTVRALAEQRPAVIVVEDLHALDPASLNLIAELAVTPDLSALLLVTSRPPDEGVAPRLAARTLAHLAGTPGAIRQHLGPLTGAEVATLLQRVYGSAVSPQIVDAVWVRTGGNPYQLTELLAASRGAGPDALAQRSTSPPNGTTRPDGTAPLDAADLTAREIEVLSCLASGMSNKQVASALGISIRTVTVHVSNLLRKTRSASRTEAALWAVRHRLVRP